MSFVPAVSALLAWILTWLGSKMYAHQLQALSTGQSLLKDRKKKTDG
jgi:hypothetical protein